jgi:hypothetical protein
MISDILFFTKFLLMGEKKRSEVIKNPQSEITVYRLISRCVFFLRWLPLDLQTIFKLSGTDKHSSKGHWYAPHYKSYFSGIRLKRIKMLEIGIGGASYTLGGRSINAWKCYFPFAHLVACDIEDKSILKSSRVTIRQLDQSDAKQLQEMITRDGPFDIIIDDGSHVNSHQILTFQNTFSGLKNNGVYVIEDIQTSFWKKYGGEDFNGVGFEDTCFGYFTEMSKYLNYCEFENTKGSEVIFKDFADQICTISFHHNLIVIKKDTMKKWSNVLKPFAPNAS